MSITTCTNGYCQFTQDTDQKRGFCQTKSDICQQIVKVYERLKTHGVHSANRLRTAGFEYTGNGDTTRCDTCSLEVSGWIREMDPYTVHRERSPNCLFIRSMQSKNKLLQNHVENVAKRQKTELGSNPCNQQSKLIELNILQEIRRRTYSHWVEKEAPTKEQMITAGFFHCNVGDRVICLYCNIICQQWKKNIDNPVEVHETISPKCPYVLSMLTQQEGPSSVLIVNEMSTNNNNNAALLLNNLNRFQSDQIVYTSPCHVSYASIPSRKATFETWTSESSPSVDDLVRAGFFYTGAKNIVTCFYCNGSLQNWGKNDNPLIEHIRWFIHCQYAKQLAGNDLYNKVQETKARERSQNTTNTTGNTSVTNCQRSLITDERILSRLVAARLDLPISQRLLDQSFKLSVIKRCWEDQLQLKQDDFVTDCDLFIACVILQKQIEYINGNKDNIIVPSKKMKSIRDGLQSDTLVQEQPASTSLSTRTSSSNTAVTNVKETLAPAPSVADPMTVETTTEQAKTEEVISETKLTINNPCILCWKEEKRLACIPCGHLVTCTNCSQTLRTCPTCRRGIEAFVRIYL